MARRRNAAAVAEDQTQADEPAKQHLTRRRAGAVAAQVPVSKAAAAGDRVEPVEDPVASMSWLQYYPRQYGGLILGTAACCNTVVFYDQEDPFMVSKLLAWMFLALLGLAIHEYRPYKRMTYEDKSRSNGIGWRQIMGM